MADSSRLDALLSRCSVLPHALPCDPGAVAVAPARTVALRARRAVLRSVATTGDALLLRARCSLRGLRVSLGLHHRQQHGVTRKPDAIGLDGRRGPHGAGE